MQTRESSQMLMQAAFSAAVQQTSFRMQSVVTAPRKRTQKSARLLMEHKQPAEPGRQAQTNGRVQPALWASNREAATSGVNDVGQNKIHQIEQVLVTVHRVDIDGDGAKFPAECDHANRQACVRTKWQA